LGSRNIHGRCAHKLIFLGSDSASETRIRKQKPFLTNFDPRRTSRAGLIFLNRSAQLRSIHPDDQDEGRV